MSVVGKARTDVSPFSEDRDAHAYVSASIESTPLRLPAEFIIDKPKKTNTPRREREGRIWRKKKMQKI